MCTHSSSPGSAASSRPALVPGGLDDPLRSTGIDEMIKDAIPSSQLSIIPVAEHASIHEQPAYANFLIAQSARRLPST